MRFVIAEGQHFLKTENFLDNGNSSDTLSFILFIQLYYDLQLAITFEQAVTRTGKRIMQNLENDSVSLMKC